MSIYRRRLMIANALKKSDSNINYPGLIAAWSAKGKSNDDADRDVLRDLTGNGYDLTLNNFAFSRMSGYGLYNVPHLSSWKIQQATGEKNVKKISQNKLQIKIVNGALLWSLMSAGSTFKIRCSEPNAQLAGENCIYTKISEDTYSVECTKGYRGGLSILNPNDFLNKTIEFELLPEYPDALVFDGVDDYCDCAMIQANLFKENFTFICKREYITEPSSTHRMTTANCRAANVNASVFTFEGFFNYPYISVYSKNPLTYDHAPVDYSLNTTFLTPTNYNGHTFKHSGDNNYEDDAKIMIGGVYTNSRYANMAFYSAYLFDRSLDEQEIKAFIRKYIDADYLLPSEQTTE